MKGFRVTVAEVKELMDRGESIFFIDARTPADWDQTDTKVQGAFRIPASEMEGHLNEIPRDRTVITY
jgi:rhodanese-related sulfurtransferase